MTLKNLSNRLSLATVLMVSGSGPCGYVFFFLSKIYNVSHIYITGMVHRDLKLENILMAQNPKDKNDKLYIKVSC